MQMIGFGDVCLLAIAIGVWVLVIAGANAV
jgi:hypothetical protein